MAFALPLLVFHHGFSQYDCTGDVCTNSRALWGNHVGIPENPIPLKNQRTGEIILKNGKPIMGAPTREGIVGIVIRDRIPTGIGLVGGLLAPLTFLIAALIVGLRTKNTANQDKNVLPR
jgi:hypothetical protein